MFSSLSLSSSQRIERSKKIISQSQQEDESMELFLQGFESIPALDAPGTPAKQSDAAVEVFVEGYKSLELELSVAKKDIETLSLDLQVSSEKIKKRDADIKGITEQHEELGKLNDSLVSEIDKKVGYTAKCKDIMFAQKSRIVYLEQKLQESTKTISNTIRPI